MYKTSTPGPSGHPRQRWTVRMRFALFIFVPLWRGQGEDGKQETGDRRRFQTIPSNVQNIHPRPARAGHPRQRGTLGMRFALFIKVFFQPRRRGTAPRFRLTGFLPEIQPVLSMISSRVIVPCLKINGFSPVASTTVVAGIPAVFPRSTSASILSPS